MKEEDTPWSQEQEAVPRAKGQGEAQMSSCRQDERGRVWEEWQKYAGSLSLALEKLECWQSPKLDVGKHFENYCSQRASSFQHSGDGGQVISDSKTAAAT